MQQAPPTAQTSRLLSSAFYLLVSGSARAPENQKEAIQKLCGENLLGVVSSYIRLLCHSVLVIFEGLMAERVERSPEPSWAQVQHCPGRFISLSYSWHSCSMICHIFTKTPYGLRRFLQKQWCPLLAGNVHQSPNPWQQSTGQRSLNKSILPQSCSWSSHSIWTRPGNSQFRGQSPSLAELFLRNYDLLWKTAPWREIQSGYSLALAWILSHWKGILPNLRVPHKDMKTWWPSGSHQSPRGLPHCLLGLRSRERSQRRDHKPQPTSQIDLFLWDLFFEIDHFFESQCRDLKACAVYKEAAHTSQEQLKPAHPFIWLRTWRRTTKLNNL